MTAEDTLRSQVRAALGAAGISQAYAARTLGISTKHLCQMLTGRAALPLGWAEDIVALCGMRVEVLVLTGISALNQPEETPS